MKKQMHDIERRQHRRQARSVTGNAASSRDREFMNNRQQ
jgi:hypothetical protein